ncbi:homoserine O-acetyltransferase MetX [Cribrihabitans neustonicus]|uniref:homoserine O-acetyltransferase MetX n=1 Tax=Cribrihabitans neustonicus TaxID=1429085 RepID=UPI003B59F846
MNNFTPPDSTCEIVPPASRFLTLPGPFAIKHGGELRQLRIAYETWGRLSPAKDNAILILAGFSASAHAASQADDPGPGWWEQMIGPGKPIDTDRWHVICVNALGSCFGSTGPASLNPSTGRPYRLDFPAVAMEDVADAAACVVEALGIRQLACLIGTSMGGMSALAYLSRNPGSARSHINISGAAQAATFAIALRSLQRQAIRSDPDWAGGRYSEARYPENGMRIARMLGMLSYRSAAEWQQRFARDRVSPAAAGGAPFLPEFMVESYLQHHADRFIGRYDPNCYLYLSRAIDRFDLAEIAGGDLSLALSQLVLQKALVIGTASDVLFPLWQQEQIAAGLSAGSVPTEMVHLHSDHGHDAFLSDFGQLIPAVDRFLASL